MKLLEIPTFSEKQSGLQRFLGESCINSAANKQTAGVVRHRRPKKEKIDKSIVFTIKFAVTAAWVKSYLAVLIAFKDQSV